MVRFDRSSNHDLNDEPAINDVTFPCFSNPHSLPAGASDVAAHYLQPLDNRNIVSPVGLVSLSPEA